MFWWEIRQHRGLEQLRKLLKPTHLTPLEAVFLLLPGNSSLLNNLKDNTEVELELHRIRHAGNRRRCGQGNTGGQTLLRQSRSKLKRRNNQFKSQKEKCISTSRRRSSRRGWFNSMKHNKSTQSPWMRSRSFEAPEARKTCYLIKFSQNWAIEIKLKLSWDEETVEAMQTAFIKLNWS
jgi:hypothetical protein